MKTVFAKQRELMVKYEQIEQENGFVVSNVPVDINNKFDQLKLKEMAWRITEELSEAMEEIKVGNVQETKGELADVLHFLSEFTILLGMEEDIHKLLGEPELQGVHYDAEELDLQLPEALFSYGVITFHLAMACHELKNKPWKQSYKETDIENFKIHFQNTWKSFLHFCYGNQMSYKELIYEYHKKHQKNVERQNSGY